MKKDLPQAALVPPYPGDRVWKRLAHEAWEHLWPWTSAGLRRQPAHHLVQFRRLQQLHPEVAARIEAVARERGEDVDGD